MWKAALTADHEDVLPSTPFGLCWCGSCVIVNIVLIILFFPCTMTQLGQFKYGLLRNKFSGYVNLEKSYEPGRYWIGFWKEFVEFPSTLQTIEFSEEKPEEGVVHLKVLNSRDKDGKRVFLDVSIQYRLEKDKIGIIYKDMLTMYEDIFISELRDQIAKAANLFKIQDAWLNYNSMVELMKGRCRTVLAKRHAICWDLQVWGLTLTKGYEAKLIETQVKKQAQRTQTAKKRQALVRAQTSVLLAEYKKNVTILKSKGEADKYNIVRLAYATAEANKISAQAQGLQIVRDRVCPKDARALDSSTGMMNCGGNTRMSTTQMVAYQKQVLLKLMESSQMVYNLEEKPKHKEAINVEATRTIINGPKRRLLIKEGGYDPERDARIDSGENVLLSDKRQLLLAESQWSPEEAGLLNLDSMHLDMPDNLMHEL